MYYLFSLDEEGYCAWRQTYPDEVSSVVAYRGAVIAEIEEDMRDMPEVFESIFGRKSKYPKRGPSLG